MKKICIILSYAIFAIFSIANAKINILKSDKNMLVFEYIPSITKQKIIINQKEYIWANLNDASNYRSKDKFEFQIYRELVGVPSISGAEVTIVSQDFDEQQGLLAPAKNYKGDYFFANGYETSKIGEFFNKEEIYNSRGLNILPIIFKPIQFDYSGNKIRILKKITLQVQYKNVPSLSFYNEATSLLSGVLLNYNIAKFWSKKTSKLNKSVASILSTGDWYKFPVTNEGIYKIDYSKLAEIGIDPKTVDPRTIRMYSNGGKPLSIDIRDTLCYDPREIAIYVNGESDGKFDAGDYILFYGQGVNFWQSDTTNGSVKRISNPFCTENYYYITSGGQKGKRMYFLPKYTAKNPVVVNQSEAYVAHEDDKVNLAKTGQEFFGDEFTDNLQSRTYLTSLPGLLENSIINYRTRFISAISSGSSQNISLYEKNQQIYTGSIFGGVTDESYGNEYVLRASSLSSGITDQMSNLKISLTQGSNGARGFLDYFEINYKRSLKAVGDQITVYTKDTSAYLSYVLSDFSNSNIKVFDVTDHNNVRAIDTSSINGTEYSFQIPVENYKVRKLYGLTLSKVLIPTGFAKVENQDLKSDISGAKLIIISHPNFLTEAERLKNFKSTRSYNPISTKVVNLQQVWTEFGCGNRDITAIRNYLKYAYSNWKIKPEYVLFMGDASYDYRNIEKQNTNFVLTYEVVSSLDLVSSYATDDYFCGLENPISSIDNIKIDIVPGRITCRTNEEAKIVVDKIIKYESDTKSGAWRNTITLVADDQYRPSTPDNEYPEISFTQSSESLARNNFQDFQTINKIYSAKYPFVRSSAGRRRPEVNQAIIDAVNNGTLLVNYIGHGSPTVWADEAIFEAGTSISKMSNDKLFFLTAATCSFGYFDFTDQQCGPEMMLGKENTGMIGGFAFDRPVYEGDNNSVLQCFIDSLFSKTSNRGVGKGILKMKQRITGMPSQKLICFGDPSLQLAIPEGEMVIDSINGISLKVLPNIKALEKVVVKGKVTKNNKLDSGYNGEAILSVYDTDKNEKISCLDNYEIKQDGGILYRGKININNGRFEGKFTVPKDISYSNNNGKIVLYYYNGNLGEDGVGCTKSFTVGGTDTNTITDTKGPVIEVAFNDIQNKNSTLIQPNSKMLITLRDETGLNTTGTGLGHKLEMLLDGDEKNTQDLTKYYVGDLNSDGKSGLVEYNFSNLSLGSHKLKIKAWDLLNNSTSYETEFKVVDDANIYVTDVYNYPNPMTSTTYFMFQHSLNEPINVKIKIYTVAGRMIKTLDTYASSDKYLKIYWDGCDQDGNRLANGTYFYKLTVSSLNDSYKTSKLGKLAIIR